MFGQGINRVGKIVAKKKKILLNRVRVFRSAPPNISGSTPFPVGIGRGSGGFRLTDTNMSITSKSISKN